MTKKDREAAAAKERRRKKKMQIDMAPTGLTPEEVQVGMLVKVIGDLTAKGVVLEHRKTRLRVDFSSTGGPPSKWIECNLKTLLFDLEPGKSEQITGAWARSDEYLGIVVEADDGEGHSTLRLGDGSHVTVAKETVKRARPSPKVLVESFWERGSHARVKGADGHERLGVIMTPLRQSKVSSELPRVRMLWTDTGALSDSTIETSMLEPVWKVTESRRIVRGWCKVGSWVRFESPREEGEDEDADDHSRSRLGVVCAHTFSTHDPAKLVEVRWADGGSDNIPGTPERWSVGQGPGTLSPCWLSKGNEPRCWPWVLSEDEIAREWWRIGSVAMQGSRLGMVVRAAEMELGDPEMGEDEGEEVYVKVIWSDGVPSGGKWRHGMPRGSVSVTALKPAYSDEDVAAAVVGWCRPAAFVRHYGQLCEVLSYIDTTDNSVQIRYAGPAKANRATVSTRNTPGAGTAWVAELTPAQVEGFPLWVWDTSVAEPVFQIADKTGPGQTRPSTAGTLGSRDHRGFDFGPGRIEEEVPEPPRLRLPGKLNIYVGADHPRYDRAVRASSPPPEEAPPAMMLENDDEMSAMAAEAREAQEWLASLRKMLADEDDENDTAAVPQFARDEWGAPIKQKDLMKQREEQERIYLEKRLHEARRDSMSSMNSDDSDQHQHQQQRRGGGGHGGAGAPGRPQPRRPSTAGSSYGGGGLPPI